MRIAVYPTSANPPTYGHADILVRTTKQFDHVFWSAAMNSEKHYMFNEEVRLRMMNEYVQHFDLKNVTVEAFTRFYYSLRAKTKSSGNSERIA